MERWEAPAASVQRCEFLYGNSRIELWKVLGGSEGLSKGLMLGTAVVTIWAMVKIHLKEDYINRP